MDNLILYALIHSLVPLVLFLFGFLAPLVVLAKFGKMNRLWLFVLLLRAILGFVVPCGLSSIHLQVNQARTARQFLVLGNVLGVIV